jgi:hypothetical protein
VRSVHGPKFEEHEATAQDEGEGFVILADDDPISVIFVDASVPADLVEWPLKLNSTWPDAAAVVERSRAHIIIGGLREKATHDDVFEQALAVTLIAATISQYLPVEGVIFPDAERICSPNELRRGAMRLANRQVPGELWSTIQFIAESAAGGRRIGALSYGLMPFIGRELEFQPADIDLEGVAKRMLGLSHYLIVNGPVIKDGETVGLTPSEKIHIRFRDEGRRSAVPILELTA